MEVRSRFGFQASGSFLFLLVTSGVGCGDSDSPPTDSFAAAAALEASWCVQAQRTVEGFDEASLPDAVVTQQTHQNAGDFVSSRADVKDGVLHVQALVVPYEEPSQPADGQLSHFIGC